MKTMLYMVYQAAAFGAGVIAAGTVWSVSLFGFDVHFLLSSLYGLAGFAAVFTGLKWYGQSRLLKSLGLSKSEYRFIKENIKEANEKIRRLQKSMFSFKDPLGTKKNFDMFRKVKKVHDLVRKDPKRFYQAEPFYFYHLNSVVELTEKHAFLSRQPSRSPEMISSLHETRDALKQLETQIEGDMDVLLKDDLYALNMELDMAKQTLDKKPLIK